MVPGIFRLALRSVKYSRRPVFYQILITGLLSAVITGSLLTGYSVRESLRQSGRERLGNASFLVSSGTRYLDSNLVKKIISTSGKDAAGLIETSGFVQNLTTQNTSLNANVFAVDERYFKFQGDNNIVIPQGGAVINSKLAENLNIKTGDDVIVKFKKISEIPSDAPFAPSDNDEFSAVFKVSGILSSAEYGNFSFSISQLTPANIFINLSDVADLSGSHVKINRIIIGGDNNQSVDEYLVFLKKILAPEDIGLTLRKIEETGGFELISDRVFIDDILLQEIHNSIQSSAPVITYLANSLSYGGKSTPYSFISGIPSELYSSAPGDGGVIINKWLGDDLGALAGDSLVITWYAPDSLNYLTEKSSKLRIEKIVPQSEIFGDSLLMPEFPGIAGSESCTDWDAGVTIKTDLIRDKDEAYWNRYKGTPKAFINYNTGKKFWGNNFGPATAIRFPVTLSASQINSELAGKIDPSKAGITVRNIYSDTLKAASESVDFSTLFLSLGFFLILAAFVLLSFVASSYFDSKRLQIRTLHAIGFKDKLIRKIQLTEILIVSFAGSVAGIAGGLIVTMLITSALNSVWQGAVQTDTLKSFYGNIPVIIGFISTFFMVMILYYLKIKGLLKKLNQRSKEQIKRPVIKNALVIFIISAFFAIAVLISSFLFDEYKSSLSFLSGGLVLVSLLLFWRYYFLRDPHTGRKLTRMSMKYYAFNLSSAVAPILFIAAGIFAVFITEGNRMRFDENHLTRSAGTGGYLLWAETRIPVNDDLNTIKGRSSAGLDDASLSDLVIFQARRSQGDDASCLNLNHVTMPPLLAFDPKDLINRGSFSFAKSLKEKSIKNTWEYLNLRPANNTIYGIADMTVLEWGLKINVGDTLIMRSENGQPLKIIIAAGLKSSVFQGYVLIGSDIFREYFPSVSGSSVFLIDGKPDLTETYKNLFEQNFEGKGIKTEKTTDRLAAFYQVTNTYLSVFSFFGVLGLITGIAGLGFVLLRNYSRRKREFALLLAIGIPLRKIRKMILTEQSVILFAGISTGIISSLIATLPTLIGNNVPWLYLTAMIAGIIITGLLSLSISVRSITRQSLINNLRKE